MARSLYERTQAVLLPSCTRIVGLAACALALGLVTGCAGMYGKVGATFAEAHGEAAEALALVTKDAQHVARVEHLESRYLKGVREQATLDGFVAVVCAGSGALAPQRAAVKTLGLYSKSVADLAKTPDQNVAALWASIAKNSEARDPLVAKKAGDPATACKEEVGGLIAMPVPPVEEAAILAVLKFSQMIGAADKIFTGTLSLIDEWQRARALAEYVKASDPVVKQVLKVLGQQSASLQDLCQKPDQRNRPYCRRFNEVPEGQKEAPVPTRLDAAFLRLKWASLRRPYRYFEATTEIFDKWNPQGRALSPARSVEMYRRLAVLEQMLASYDALRVTPSPGDISSDLRDAHQALLDLAEGRISAGEAWAALASVAATLGEVAKATQDYRDARSMETKPRPADEADAGAGT